MKGRRRSILLALAVGDVGRASRLRGIDVRPCENPAMLAMWRYGSEGWNVPRALPFPPPCAGGGGCPLLAGPLLATLPGAGPLLATLPPCPGPLLATLPAGPLLATLPCCGILLAAAGLGNPFPATCPTPTPAPPLLLGGLLNPALITLSNSSMLSSLSSSPSASSSSVVATALPPPVVPPAPLAEWDRTLPGTARYPSGPLSSSSSSSSFDESSSSESSSDPDEAGRAAGREAGMDLSATEERRGRDPVVVVGSGGRLDAAEGRGRAAGGTAAAGGGAGRLDAATGGAGLGGGALAGGFGGVGRWIACGGGEGMRGDCRGDREICGRVTGVG